MTFISYYIFKICFSDNLQILHQPQNWLHTEYEIVGL
jgi:hypothetical protein